VAHRLNTVQKFDKIVVLEGGRILEDGAPEALLQIEGGRFRALWSREG
jgi:ABC-type multidrug transport system fused ATPase/permease subunit